VDGENPIDIGNYIVTENVTFTAIFRVHTYTVTFKNGNTTLSMQTIEHGKFAVVPTAPTQTGYEGNSNKKEDALRLLAIINKFRENQTKKCSEYKTILHLLQKIEPQIAINFVERFKGGWNNACNGIIDYSKAICVMEDNKKTSIVFFSASPDIAKQDFYVILCDAKQQQHKVDAVLLIVFIGESNTACRIDWIYFEKPFVAKPDVLNEYIEMGLIPPEYKITMSDK
jgi:hypothetical protein